MIEKKYCEVCGNIQNPKETHGCKNCGMHEEFLKAFSYTLPQNKETAHICIIGNGVAGFSVAKTLRNLHSKNPITIFTKGNHTPYNYIKLNKDMLLYHDLQVPIDTTWYAQQQVTLKQHEEITGLDTQKQEIYTKQQAYAYDILVFAMGSERILPQIAGNELTQIYTVDALYDQQVLQQIMKPSRHGVVIGSDIQSIELACALNDAHIQVDIIEALPHLMPQELNTMASELLSAYLKRQKIQLHTNCTIKQFHGTSRIESIEFSNGKCINADFVICASSFHANLSLLENSGILYDKRIFINEQMRTNIANIYACGSISHSFHITENSFLYAQQQGMLVAFHILGITPPFQPHLSPRYFKHDDFSICLLGDIHHYDQHIEIFNDQTHAYEKYCYNEEQCSGVLIMNKDTQIQGAIKHFNEKSKFQSK